MSFKGISHLLRKQNVVYIAEHEEVDWTILPENHPVFSLGCGAFSESQFGIYHPDKGVIKKISFNSYPTGPLDSITLKIKCMSKTGEIRDLGNYTFIGHMHSLNTSIYLPNEENQIIISHVSNTYPSSIIRTRIYITVEEI